MQQIEYFLNFFRLEERLAQRKAKLAEMKKSQEEELSKNDPDKQESLAKVQVGTPDQKYDAETQRLCLPINTY